MANETKPTAEERERIAQERAEAAKLPAEVRAQREQEDAEVKRERDAVEALPVGWERSRREAALREREQALAAERPSVQAVFLAQVFRNLAYEVPRPERLEEIVDQADAQLKAAADAEVEAARAAKAPKPDQELPKPGGARPDQDLPERPAPKRG